MWPVGFAVVTAAKQPLGKAARHPPCAASSQWRAAAQHTAVDMQRGAQARAEMMGSGGLQHASARGAKQSLWKTTCPNGPKVVGRWHREVFRRPLLLSIQGYSVTIHPEINGAPPERDIVSMVGSASRFVCQPPASTPASTHAKQLGLQT